MAKRIPVRSCCVCRHRGAKNEFMRIVRTPDLEVVIDDNFKISGRGAYLCREQKCIDKAFRTKAIERALHCMEPVSKDLYERLKETCLSNVPKD